MAEAKAKLSQTVRRVTDGPVVIHNRGRDVAVLVAVDEFERLPGRSGGGGQAFLSQLEALKARHGGGVDDFVPGTLRFTAASAFSRRTRRG